MKAWSVWALSHGMTRTSLLAAARRGDLVARLAVEPGLRADPFWAYEKLRGDGNLVHGRLISAAVGHAAANHILRSDAFGVAAGRGGLPRPVRRVMARLDDPEVRGPVDPPSLLAIDAPDHTRLRKQVSKAFTARSVAALQADVTAVAKTLLDDLDGHPSFDLVERYAARLPVEVIADLLGVPSTDRAQVLAWGNDAALLLDPGLTWREFRRARTAVAAMHRWFEAHVERLRAAPGDDLLSRLAVGEGPDRLDDDELRAVGLLVLGAGFETTVSLIGNAVACLSHHPDQLELLHHEPQRWPNAVEEVLRYDSPVQLTLREAYADTVVGGVPVAQGRPVLVYLGAANRDPAVFAEPARFDVTRHNAGDHLTFSAGPHYCLGASLARLEGAVGLRCLYERYPGLKVSAEPTRRRTRVLRGYERLPVTV